MMSRDLVMLREGPTELGQSEEEADEDGDDGTPIRLNQKQNDPFRLTFS